MSAQNLSKVQFNARAEGQYDNIHVAWATVDDKEVGQMEWFKKGGVIRNIDVDESHQRKGIATGMWNAAHKVAKEQGLATPKHDADSISPSGMKWAYSVGGEWERGPRER